MAVNTFVNNDFNIDSPAPNAVAVVLNSPISDFGPGVFCRALYIGGAGDATIVTRGGQTVLFSGLPAGFILPVCATQVNTSGTTATNIVALG